MLGVCLQAAAPSREFQSQGVPCKGGLGRAPRGPTPGTASRLLEIADSQARVPPSFMSESPGRPAAGGGCPEDSRVQGVCPPCRLLASD